MSHSNVERIVIKDGCFCTEIITKDNDYDERKIDIRTNVINKIIEKNSSNVQDNKNNNNQK